MAQWIALAAHGQWFVGSIPIKVIGCVRKGIRPQLLLCSKDKSVPRPAHKKSLNQGFSQCIETLNGREFIRSKVCALHFLSYVVG